MTEEFKANLIERILGEEQAPLPYYLGMKAESIEEGKAVLSLKADPQTLNGSHIVHGGAMMTLVDCAMGMACFTYGKRVVTLDANINYLKAAPEGGDVFCYAEVLHNGRVTMVATCDIKNAAGKLLAQARGTFFVLGEFTE